MSMPCLMPELYFRAADRERDWPLRTWEIQVWYLEAISHQERWQNQHQSLGSVQPMLQILFTYWFNHTLVEAHAKSTLHWETHSVQINMLELYTFFLQPAKICTPAKFKSGIWKYFYLKKDEEHRTFRAVCIVCSKSLAYSRGGTSTMWRHMQSIHSIEKPSKD